jgi:hypothetical protein
MSAIMLKQEAGAGCELKKSHATLEKHMTIPAELCNQPHQAAN